MTKHFNKKINKNNSKKGLILLELIVALGVFISVMTIGMGAVLTMFGVNQKSQSLKDIMTNLNFALDSMAREIVVAKVALPDLYGSSLRCSDSDPTNSLDIPQDCPISGNAGGGQYLSFCSSDGNLIAYKFNDALDSQSIERKVSIATGCPSSFSGEEWQRITSPGVKVEKMKFFLTGGQDKNDGKQPKVILVVEGEAGIKDDVKSRFEVQTTLSQRAPDLSVVIP